eukprot:3694726-Pyramimonas_sp.AAC.1
MAVFACGSPSQYSVSWPQSEFHRSPLRGPMGGSTECLNGGVRIRFVAPHGILPKASLATVVSACGFPAQ